MAQRKQGIQYIKDSEVKDLNIPTSMCVFQNKDKYFMVEVNTGNYKGSIKVISGPYTDYGKLLNDNHRMKFSSYPLLQNHIIYNEKIMCSL